MSAHDSNSSHDHDDDNDSYSETTSQAGERNEMETILQNIGIISPITKYSAGRMYHQQLARQITDILLQQNRLVRLGGMITLTDLYCLLNKARGTELVSPDDLLKAASLTNSLHLGLQLHTFDSGVKVLKLNNYNEKELSEKILKLIATFNLKDSHNVIYNKDGINNNNRESIAKRVDGNNSLSDKDIYHMGVQASDVSSYFNISIIIAKEQLLLCEQYQYLCRDESIDGLFFYPNLF
jgi:ESCRT-II complex subunit VPS36